MDRRRRAITVMRGLAVIAFAGALLATTHSVLANAARPSAAARFGSVSAIVGSARDVALLPDATDRRVGNTDDRHGSGRWELLRNALLATLVGVPALAAYARHHADGPAATAARLAGRLRSTRAPPHVVA